MRALVVGANRGIGRGIVGALASAGCRVAASDIHPKPAPASDVPAYFPADLTDEQSVRALFGWAVDRLERIDVVVNSAGIGHVDPLESLRLEILAVRQMAGQAVWRRLERRGLIVHISSLAAEHGRPLSAAYGASKAALNHLSKSFAATFAEQRISTAVVAPGAVEDGMLRYLMPEIERVGGKEVAEARKHEDVFFGVHQSPSDIGAFVAAVAGQLGMTLNGMELWTTPTRRPIA